jgi:hypothetical protein
MIIKTFISYSRHAESSAFVTKLKLGLEQTRVLKIWQDDFVIQSGDELDERIENAILYDNDVFIFYLTEQALISKWVRKEFEFAFKKTNSINYYIIDKETTRPHLGNWPEIISDNISIPVINEKDFDKPILELSSAIISTYYQKKYLNVSIENVLNATSVKGINAIKTGRYNIEDDIKIEKLILASKKLRIILLNGNRFIDLFKIPLTTFLSKPNSKIQILIADPDSQFYYELSEMISPTLNLDSKNRDLVLFAIKRLSMILKDSGAPRDSIEIKFYNTQFRLPVIIFDQKLAHLTVNLPPTESSDGITLELINKENEINSNLFKECERHFETIWEKAKGVQTE